VAKHQTTGELLGHLVQGGGRKYIPGAQGASQLAKVREQPDLVCCRIARHHGAGMSPVHCEQWRQTTFDLSKGFFPTGFYKCTIAFDQRRTQPVRVFMQVFQGDALGANIASAEHVLCMALDAGDLATLHFDFQATAGFAQGTDAVVNSLNHGESSWVWNAADAHLRTQGVALSRTQVTKVPNHESRPWPQPSFKGHSLGRGRASGFQPDGAQSRQQRDHHHDASGPWQASQQADRQHTQHCGHDAPALA
jgi:hypothetical protein